MRNAHTEILRELGDIKQAFDDMADDRRDPALVELLTGAASLQSEIYTGYAAMIECAMKKISGGASKAEALRPLENLSQSLNFAAQCCRQEKPNAILDLMSGRNAALEAGQLEALSKKISRLTAYVF